MAEYRPSATASMDQGLTRMAPLRDGEQPTNSVEQAGVCRVVKHGNMNRCMKTAAAGRLIWEAKADEPPAVAIDVEALHS